MWLFRSGTLIQTKQISLSPLLIDSSYWLARLVRFSHLASQLAGPPVGHLGRPTPIHVRYSDWMFCLIFSTGSAIEALRSLSQSRTTRVADSFTFFCRATVALIRCRNFVSVSRYFAHPCVFYLVNIELLVEDFYRFLVSLHTDSSIHIRFVLLWGLFNWSYGGNWLIIDVSSIRVEVTPEVPTNWTSDIVIPLVEGAGVWKDDVNYWLSVVPEDDAILASGSQRMTYRMMRMIFDR